MRERINRASLNDRVEVDSCGTEAWHVGKSPDHRSTATAQERGVTLQGAARQFQVSDFDRFDLIVPMDRSNRDELLGLARDKSDADRIHLLRSFDAETPGTKLDVPDPYYGGEDGFVQVFEICERGCEGLLTWVQTQLKG